MLWLLRNLRNLSSLRHDAELGAAASAVQLAIDKLLIQVGTYQMDHLTADLDTSNPEERADAVTNLVLQRLPEDVRENIAGTSSVDVGHMEFALFFGEVRLALPAGIMHYIAIGPTHRS